MAIITEPLETEYPGLPTPRKVIVQTRLVKQDIVRQGHDGWTATRLSPHNKATPHPTWHCLPWHWRCVAQWAGREWYKLDDDEKDTWTSPLFEVDLFTPDRMNHNFISAQCYAFDEGWPFARTAHHPAGPWTIQNSNLTATATGGGVKLEWDQTLQEGSPPDLWGLIICRHPSPIFALDPLQLYAIVSTAAIGHQTFIDTHPLSGPNFYKCNSFNRESAWGAPTENATVTIS
jgi:hypothetical protein